jgi:hypothetical protein
MPTSVVEGNLAIWYPSCAAPSLRHVRLVFCLYLALIAAGLAFYIAVRITHH